MILLVRHVQSLLNAGETDYHDSDITKKGKNQADHIYLTLKAHLGTEWTKNPYVGFVSPFLRTLKTAEPIHKHFGIPFIVDDRIAECPDDSYMKLKLSKILNRQYIFPQFNWLNFPVNGIPHEDRTMLTYRAGLLDFVKTVPEFAIVVSHMSPVQDLAYLLTEDDSVFHNLIGNASVTVVENKKLKLIGRW